MAFSDDCLIRSYNNWQVYLHPNQGYLGRSIVWCNRADSLDFADATKAEQEELFIVLRDLKRALTELFKPDVFNYAFLGNEIRHLHGHVVPRYKEPRVLLGQVFEDRLFGRNFQTDHNFKISFDLFSKIKIKVQQALMV